jgi:hypothetical protein
MMCLEIYKLLQKWRKGCEVSWYKVRRKCKENGREEGREGERWREKNRKKLSGRERTKGKEREGLSRKSEWES